MRSGTAYHETGPLQLGHCNWAETDMGEMNQTQTQTRVGRRCLADLEHGPRFCFIDSETIEPMFQRSSSVLSTCFYYQVLAAAFSWAR